MPEEERATYEDAALEMLKALADKRCNWDENVDNLVEKCTAAYHDADHEFWITGWIMKNMYLNRNMLTMS